VQSDRNPAIAVFHSRVAAPPERAAHLARTESRSRSERGGRRHLERWSRPSLGYPEHVVLAQLPASEHRWPVRLNPAQGTGPRTVRLPNLGTPSPLELVESLRTEQQTRSPSAEVRPSFP